MANIKIEQVKPLHDFKRHHDFRELMKFCVEEYGDDDAFIIKHKGPGRSKEVHYEHKTYRMLADDLNHFGTGLLNRGAKGKRVAIIANNCYEWMLPYYAVPCGLGIAVPLDKGLPFEEALSSIIRSNSEILIFDPAHKKLVEELKQADMPVKQFYSTTPLEGYETVYDVIEEGRAILAGEKEGDQSFPELPIDPDDTALLLFTSGTSGLAKAVMLTQTNVLFNIWAMQVTQPIRRGDINMAFLPYHHTFGCDTQVMMFSCGVTTVFCDGLKYIQKNMQEYHVTIFIGVPLLVEAIYKRVMRSVEKQGKMKTFQRGAQIGKFLNRFHIDVRRRLFKQIIDELGGELRFIFCGASALDPEAIRGFESIGVGVIQGYGMTESAPVITTETIREHRPGSIGKALYGVEVEIANPNEDGIGEIIARSPSIMKGYYEDPEETAKTIIDGWLHTGDLARVNRDGYVFIAGRKKNVIVLKNGKNIYPEEIETLIASFPYVKENMVFAKEKRQEVNSELALCAKIVYDPAVMKEQFDLEDPKEIEAHIYADIETINAGMPTYKQITRLIATEEEMVKTTTGKVKRFVEENKGE
ncbi:MAG: AMP-binding protein [Bacillota bacterium]|nr:AMP-binding protein [Bacillota bacterium]